MSETLSELSDEELIATDNDIDACIDIMNEMLNEYKSKLSELNVKKSEPQEIDTSYVGIFRSLFELFIYRFRIILDPGFRKQNQEKQRAEAEARDAIEKAKEKIKILHVPEKAESTSFFYLMNIEARTTDFNEKRTVTHVDRVTKIAKKVLYDLAPLVKSEKTIRGI